MGFCAEATAGPIPALLRSALTELGQGLLQAITILKLHDRKKLEILKVKALQVLLFNIKMGSLRVYICLLKIPVRSSARDKKIGKNILFLSFCRIWIGAHAQKKQPGVCRGKKKKQLQKQIAAGKAN